MPDSVEMKFVKAPILRITMPMDASEISVRFRNGAQSTLQHMRKLATAYDEKANMEVHPDNRGITVKGGAVKPVFQAWFQAGYFMGATDLLACARMEAVLSGQRPEMGDSIMIGPNGVLIL